MKPLYESILDNEDILMNDIKNHSNNPFRVLKYYYDEIDKTRPTDPQWGPKWRKVVDEELKKIKLPKSVYYKTFTDHIKFMSRSGKCLFDIDFEDNTIEIFTKKDACCVMEDSTKDLSKTFSHDERRIVRDFCKKYDFKSTNPNHAYCMWLYLDK